MPCKKKKSKDKAKYPKIHLLNVIVFIKTMTEIIKNILEILG